MNSQNTSKSLLRNNILLAHYTTMQVGGPADTFAEPSNEKELSEVLTYIKENHLPFMLMGKGANMIFPDEGYRGAVIALTRFERDRFSFDREKETAVASSGVNLFRLSAAAKDAGLAGMEFLSSIPGTVGGALRMNAGFSRIAGKKNEIGTITESVKVMTFDGVKKELSKNDLKFSYRHSNLDDCVILEGTFRLKKSTPEEVEKEIKANYDYRNREQDLKHASSGSIFKNPGAPHPTAGQIIDRLGLKGMKVGGIQVSEKHGNYFINTGGGKTTQLLELMAQVQEIVFKKEGISLEPEVKLIHNE